MRGPREDGCLFQFLSGINKVKVSQKICQDGKFMSETQDRRGYPISSLLTATVSEGLVVVCI